MKSKLFLLTILLTLLLSACVPKVIEDPHSSSEPRVLHVLTHDSFDITAELLAKFEAENNVKVMIIKGGDTGSALNRLILTSSIGAVEADVFNGLVNTFL